MESGKSTRQRLVTLVMVLLGVALLYLAFGDIAFARMTARPPAAARFWKNARRIPAIPPGC